MNRLSFEQWKPALDSDDLALCQDVFESVCSDLEIEPASEEAQRVGRIVVRLRQAGVEGADLLAMVRSARGIG